MRDVFQRKAVQNGQVIRRKVRDIERYAGMDVFLAEVRARGFQAVQNREQVVIFCNSAPLRRLV
ncbi:aspartate aminotransferase [Cribrihabitans pelagius]|uniref:aspartate aminotransferase n=1 Tax=Cribrihabitans pelagius TaxID=1765746 RepID=UPI003B5C1838